MAGEPFTFWDYLKAAFWYKPRAGFLGPLPLNQLALLLTGVAALALRNPAPLLLGGALEVGYLAFLSSHPSFQKLIQGEQLMQKQVGWEDKIRESLASLPQVAQARYRALYQQCGQILGIAQTMGSSDGVTRDMRAGSLNQLLWMFLRLLASRELIIGNLAQVNGDTLESDIARLKERLAQAGAPDTPLARSLQGTLDIQVKRLENLTKARSTQEVIEAELDRIEQQVRLLREESAVTSGPEGMSSRLDAITATLGETSKWMDQNAEILGSISMEEADGPSLSLPRIPEPAQPATPPPPPPRRRQQQ